MNKNLNCIVIGYGSIGRRHVRILTELGHRVSVVSRRDIDYPIRYTNLGSAMLIEQPDYIIIANETSNHERTLNEIIALGYNGKILIEKPLFPFIKSTVVTNLPLAYVGYNLRFHPIIQTLYERLKGIKVISVHAYVGQYLPSWRSGEDYSRSYSANAKKGGGVLRDLSHELDYLKFLFGEWRELVAHGGRFSQLNIDSDDHFSISYQSKDVPIITLQMNYIDHITQRFIIINTNEATYKADLITNTLQINEQIIQYSIERDDTYTAQHKAVINDDNEFLCSYDEGIDLAKMIEKSEMSSQRKVWVLNE